MIHEDGRGMGGVGSRKGNWMDGWMDWSELARTVYPGLSADRFLNHIK